MIHLASTYLTSNAKGNQGKPEKNRQYNHSVSFQGTTHILTKQCARHGTIKFNAI